MRPAMRLQATDWLRWSADLALQLAEYLACKTGFDRGKESYAYAPNFTSGQM